MKHITTDELIGFLNNITPGTVWEFDWEQDYLYTAYRTYTDEAVFIATVQPFVKEVLVKVCPSGGRFFEVVPHSAP